MSGNGDVVPYRAPDNLAALNYEEEVPRFDEGEIVFVLPREDDERPYACCFMVTRVYDMTDYPEMYDVISSNRLPDHPMILKRVCPRDMVLVPARKASAMRDQFPDAHTLTSIIISIDENTPASHPAHDAHAAIMADMTPARPSGGALDG